MKFFIAYEAGGVEKNLLSEFEVEGTAYSESLTRSDLLSILEYKNIETSEDSILSYFDEQQNAYFTLRPEDKVPKLDRLKILIRKPMPFTTEELKKKIEYFEKKVKELTKKLESKELPTFSYKKSTERVYEPLYSELDIAILYAAPLIMNTNDGFVGIEDYSLDFESETRSLIEYLENKDIGADIRFEAATADNFREILEYKPKIIYFSGQSYIKLTPSREFVLAFEKSIKTSEQKQEIGLIDEMTSEKLKKILKESPQSFQVLILKGGYSNEMADIFLKAGFSCVIAVQDHKSEAKSNKFIKELCRNLLKGETINTAFKKAENSLDDDFSDVHCCCAHRHKASCEWANTLTLSNSVERHNEHVSENCCKQKGSIHKIGCSWGMTFNHNYCKNREIKDKEYIDDKIKICCCSAEIEHLRLKYSIHCDQSVLDQVLFVSHKKNNVEFMSGLPIDLKPPYNDKITVGRRVEICELIKEIVMNRSVNVTGPCGIGKTMLVRRVGQYIYDRKVFKDGVVYVDFLTKADIGFFYRYISNTLNLPDFEHYSELFATLKNLDVVMIIDNIDSLLKYDRISFIKTYELLMTSTVKPKFIICSRIFLNLVETSEFTVTSLTEEQAIRLIRSQSVNKKIERIDPEFFAKYGTSPTDVLQKIFPLISSGNPAAQVSSISLSYLHMTRNVPDSEKIFRLVYYFPSGVYDINLKYLCQKDGFNYKLVLEQLNNKTHSLNSFIHADPGFKFLVLKRDLASHLESTMKVDKNELVSVVSHLAMFARGIFKAFLASDLNIDANIRNGLLYLNAGLEQNMWSHQFEQSSLIATEINEPEAIFNKIQANFWYYIDVERLKKLFENNEIDIKNFIEEIIICMASIFVLLGNSQDALEIINRGKKCFVEFDWNNHLYRIKLIEAAVCASFDQFSRKAFELLDETLNYYEKIKNLEGVAESLLLRGVLKENSQDFIKAFDIFSINNNDLGRARAGLGLSEVYRKQNFLEFDFFAFLNESGLFFQNFKFFFWQAKAKICLSDWYLAKDELIKAEEILNSTLLLTKEHKDYWHEKEATKRLVNIKELWEKNALNETIKEL